MMASDAISFFGRARKKLVAGFGESVPPSGSKGVGRYLGHQARTGSNLIMNTGGVVKLQDFE